MAGAVKQPEKPVRIATIDKDVSHSYLSAKPAKSGRKPPSAPRNPRNSGTPWHDR
jgi:hypothetical protein